MKVMGQLFHTSHKGNNHLIDELIYIVAFIGPLMTIPQVTTIWLERKVEGISIITWSSYGVLAIFWISYGLIHKERTIILANFLFLLVNTAVVLGALIFN